ncbi:MAG TPA: HAMP domain-containing sensor histidine kinase [Microthrixaceae bacterium]|nr:HAMP domain-containing sensor histidine kinase [Microthrixaceae bacterium]
METARSTRSRWHLPGRTLRGRLTLLYSGLFVISGFLVLAITNVGARSTAVGLPAPRELPVGGPPSPAFIDQPGDTGGLDRLWVSSIVALAVMAVISVGLGWLIAGRALRPLRTITTTARQISATNLHQRLALDGPDDEVKELGETLDDLFARLEASFESQRHFVANASHELRTPLTAERALIQVALADPDVDAAALRATCEEVLTLGSQQELLIESLLTLASSERGVEKWEPFGLGRITEDVVVARAADAERLEVRVDTNCARAPAEGDPSLVESLVTNLVDNAIHHNAIGGRVEVSTVMTDGRAVIAVRNTGPVIPAAEVDRLFQPFQRLGDERMRHPDGHGLGLAIVRAIADAHGATITARARPEGGLDIEVAFRPAMPSTPIL